MKNFNFTFLFGFFAFLIIGSFSFAQEITWSKTVNPAAVSKYGKTFKLVNDFENILSPEEIIKLSKEIELVNKKNNLKITIVTVNDFAPYNSITSLGKDLHSSWKVGEDKKGDGIVILFSKNKRSVSIVSTLEKIPHQEINQVINNVMIPSFGKKDFYNGLLSGLKKCAELKNKYTS